jgi:hypothetical protein
MPLGTVFGVSDPAAGRHEIHLAGRNHLLVAQTVAVDHRALDHPGKGLEPDVRVRADMQAAGGGDVYRAGMIKEAPGAYRTAPVVGQGAPYGERITD